MPVDFKALLGKTKARKSIDHTDEQLAIFEHAAGLKPGKALGITARAGSGKSTSLIGCLERLPPTTDARDVCMVVFSKDAASDLIAKLPPRLPCSVRTLHATAMRMVNYSGEPAWGRDWSVVKRMEKSNKNLHNPCQALLAFGLNSAVGLPGELPNEKKTWIDMISKYGVRHKKAVTAETIATSMVRIFDSVVQEISDEDRSTDMSFDEILYAAALRGTAPRCKLLLLDEAQDTNRTQLVMIQRIMSSGKVALIFAGDPAQAIYGWRGAGVNAFEELIDAFSADVLPLTISQRCARSVIAYAQELVPDIRPRETAPEGEVQQVMQDDLLDMHGDLIRNGDVVLCRNRFPMTEFAMELLRRKRPVAIVGSDFSKQAITTLGEVFRYSEPADETAWTAARDKISAELPDKPFAREQAIDQLNTAMAFWQITGEQCRFRWKSTKDMLDDITGFIESNISDGRKPAKNAVVFSTIHGSKGLEWNRVFLLRPDLLPSDGAKKIGGFVLAQEYNLMYVARTRARNEFVEVV